MSSDEQHPDPIPPLPDPPALDEPLGPLDHELAEVVACGPGTRFQLHGRRSVAVGSAERGVETARIHGHRVAGGFDVVGAVCESALISPLGVERRLRIDGRTLVERVVVPRDGPFVAFEWATSDAGPPLELAWALDLAPGADRGPISCRSAGRLLVLAVGPWRAAVAFGVEPDAVHMDQTHAAGGGPRLGARIRLPDGGVRGVVALGGDDAALGRALRAAGRAGAVGRARRGHLAMLRDDRLGLSSPDPELDRDIERAKLRLADLAPAAEPAASHDAVRRALDALLVGEPAWARAALERMAREEDGALDHLLLAGRYLAWTGDVATIHQEWPALSRRWQAVRSGPPVSGKAALAWRAAARGLLHAAEAVGDTAAAREARGLLAGDGAPGGAAEPAHQWDGPQDRGLARLQEVLGAEPDATRGRLVLRPSPPPAWDRFRIRAVTMGDAAVSMAYERVGSTHRFVMEQKRGAAPLRLVLEPRLAGRLRAARVDGVPAELEEVADGPRTRVPVQLELDHRRAVELEMEEKKDARR